MLERKMKRAVCQIWKNIFKVDLIVEKQLQKMLYVEEEHMIYIKLYLR
jgi:hypothetical protein